MISLVLFFWITSISILHRTALYTSGFIQSSSIQFKHRGINSAHYTSDDADSAKNVEEASSTTRRHLILSSSMLLPFMNLMLDVKRCNAEETVPKVNLLGRAATQSDLGISVRKSVVQGAKVIDKIDQKWEKFSDDFGLGSERSRKDKRPEPKIIPPLLPLNEKIAKDILTTSDEVFLSLVPEITEKQLTEQINKVEQVVRKSFERAGLEEDNNGTLSHQRFNFLCYLHFKTYSDLIIKNNDIKFSTFRSKFENELGLRLLTIFLPSKGNNIKSITTASSKNNSKDLRQALLSSLQIVDEILEQSKAFGFVSISERNEIESETLDDWSQNLSDVQLSVTLDGDTTMNAQILLQEQGFRLYPDFLRFILTAILRRDLGINQKVDSEEYYLDTDYNTDPDKFEVKEVLLNIVIDSV